MKLVIFGVFAMESCYDRLNAAPAAKSGQHKRKRTGEDIGG